MSTESSFRCTDAARDRRDSLLGTAPQTARWLLVEHPGPWRVDALAGSGLPVDVLGGLHAAARRARGRVLLIRRPGRQRRNRRAWAWAVSSVGGATRWGTWEHPHDLATAADLLGGPEPVEGSRDPVLLVCTHGVHDICCALRGRPVAHALEQQWPEATWECSHLGGDRFAGNVVVLPDGTYYGNLDPATATAVVRDHLAGRVDAAHLRGMARFPPVAQVAIGAVHGQSGPYAAAAVEVGALRQLRADSWLVEVRVPGGGRHQVEVVTTPRPAAQLTCRAERSTSALGYTATVR